MKKLPLFALLIASIFLSGCVATPQNSVQGVFSNALSTPTIIITPEETAAPMEQEFQIAISEAVTQPSFSAIPTPSPFSMFYGCEMTIEFTSGPLKGKKSEFSILDRSYFEDKGDKFTVGKGTAIFYEETPYLILHSSYVDGNILEPMEAEFIRKHLEHWGNKGEEYIQQQMDQLIGSKINWTCDGEQIFTTAISDIARLSHDASERLWLEPEQIENILMYRDGLRSEWVGKMKPSFETSLYLGFCGWGPPSLESGRYTYFRYVINLTVNDL